MQVNNSVHSLNYSILSMKADSIGVEDFIERSGNHLTIDVRAPIEFAKGHLPGAINIPLFEDVERAEIGTLYKIKGKEEAVMRGLEIVSPKLSDFIRKVKSESHEKEVFVYCFRGGMRSNSFGWLINISGLKSLILTGGYKAYRSHVLKYFETPHRLILLGGATGSGKTEILKELGNNMQVVDLEGIAHHKGSAFGAIGQLPQLPQQLFEHHLFDELKKQDLNKSILLEDESMSIGYNKIPYSFWLQMKSAPIIKIKIPFELRVNRLVKEYGNAPIDQLKKSVHNISSQLGPNNAKDCLRLLDENKLADVARVTLYYYDKAYQYNHEKKGLKTIVEVETDTDDVTINSEKIKQAIEEYGNR